MADLLADGAVQRGIAGMHAGHVLATGVGLGQQADDLLQVQLGGVHHPFGAMALQYGLGYQRAGVENHRTTADQALALDGDQLGIAGAGANEIDGHDGVSESGTGDGQGGAGAALLGADQSGGTAAEFRRAGQGAGLGHAGGAGQFAHAFAGLTQQRLLRGQLFGGAEGQWQAEVGGQLQQARLLALARTAGQAIQHRQRQRELLQTLLQQLAQLGRRATATAAEAGDGHRLRRRAGRHG
ncbi:hypothetical protein D3C78_1311640 [compost metagenome]